MIANFVRKFEIAMLHSFFVQPFQWVILEIFLPLINVEMSLASICCFRGCFDGTGFTIKTVSNREQAPIILDNKNMGNYQFVSL